MDFLDNGFFKITKRGLILSGIFLVCVIVLTVSLKKSESKMDSKAELVIENLTERGYSVKKVETKLTYNEVGFTAGLYQYQFTVTYEDKTKEVWYYYGYVDINEETVKNIYKKEEE